MSKKGISGRGVLIDWYSWALEQNITFDATTPHAIPFPQLLAALARQNMDPSALRPGDILVVRSGYLSQYESMPAAKRDALDEQYRARGPENVGLEPSEELLRFLWNGKFAAVCGDSRSMEAWPCSVPEFHLHEWLLAGWGMPIGELFYLEELARVCEQLGRYTFFLSSSPMDVSLLPPPGPSPNCF